MKSISIFDDIFSKYQDENDILLITMDFPFYLSNYTRNKRLKIFCDCQMYRVLVDKRMLNYSSFINDNIGEYYSKKTLIHGFCKKAIEEELSILIYSDSEEKHNRLKAYITDNYKDLKIDGIFDTEAEDRIDEIPKFNADILFFDVSKEKHMEILFYYNIRNNLARIAVPVNDFEKSKSSFKNVVDYFCRKVKNKINKGLKRNKKDSKEALLLGSIYRKLQQRQLPHIKFLKIRKCFMMYLHLNQLFVTMK